ncbi:MAG: site-specific integrase [Candidatus Pacebacteria bacterium]|nr:site-specific integrase [Candidatus Paceibacterota bacterium]
MKKNVVKETPQFKNPNEFKKDILFWNKKEFEQFINIIKDDIVYKTFFATLYLTGMRRGEIQALTWSDFNKNELIINKTLTNKIKGVRYTILPPKTKHSNRIVKIPNNLIKLLQKLKSYYKDFEGFDNDWFIFGGHTPLSDSTIERKKNNYCKEAKVKTIRIHDFRHSHASLLVNMQIPITVISKRLGHTNISNYTKPIIFSFSPLRCSLFERFIIFIFFIFTVFTIRK